MENITEIAGKDDPGNVYYPIVFPTLCAAITISSIRTPVDVGYRQVNVFHVLILKYADILDNRANIDYIAIGY